jgi:hypothetical protein
VKLGCNAGVMLVEAGPAVNGDMKAVIQVHAVKGGELRYGGERQ